MKYLRLASDLHLDVDWHAFSRTRRYDAALEEARLRHLGRPWCEMDELWLPPKMDGDEDTVMVLAGDLWNQGRVTEKTYPEGDTWMARVARQFKYVVFVYGNHDYWGSHILKEPLETQARLEAQGLANVHFLEIGVKTHVVLDQVKFLGATLWTDYKKHDPVVMFNARAVMKDYGAIRSGGGYSKFTAEAGYHLHQRSKQAIFHRAQRDDPDQLVIVVTHMAPSYQSVGKAYRSGHPRDELSNPLYYSSLDQEILDSEIDLWFHGHTHERFDYLVGSTRVMCNPRGYVGYENTGFNPHFRLDLQGDLQGQAPVV